jgi:hypothetical protein
VPITTEVVSLNPAHGKVYLIKDYVIKFVSHWFSLGTSVSSTNKTDCHSLTEILLKLELNAIAPSPTISNEKCVVEEKCNTKQRK